MIIEQIASDRYQPNADTKYDDNITPTLPNASASTCKNNAAHPIHHTTTTD
jgi:hypothetical protein